MARFSSAHDLNQISRENGRSMVVVLCFVALSDVGVLDGLVMMSAIAKRRDEGDSEDRAIVGGAMEGRGKSRGFAPAIIPFEEAYRATGEQWNLMGYRAFLRQNILPCAAKMTSSVPATRYALSIGNRGRA